VHSPKKCPGCDIFFQHSFSFSLVCTEWYTSVSVGDCLQIWKVAANRFNKQLRTADKGLYSILGVAYGKQYFIVKFLCYKILKNVATTYGAVEVQLYSFLTSSLGVVSDHIHASSALTVDIRLGGLHRRPGHNCLPRLGIEPMLSVLEQVTKLIELYRLIECLYLCANPLKPSGNHM
jgi:hypothetical protein